MPDLDDSDDEIDDFEEDDVSFMWLEKIRMP
jgi:hypothetical protein